MSLIFLRVSVCEASAALKFSAAVPLNTGLLAFFSFIPSLLHSTNLQTVHKKV
jgi:hypothetical protein